MPSSLRSRLALLLVLANLPAAALAIGATVKGRDAETEQRESSIVQRAQLIATRAGLTLGVAEGVADTLAANRDVATASAGCAAHLDAALTFRPEYIGIVVSDHDGRTLCAAGETRISAQGQSAISRAIRTQDEIGDTVFLPETIPDKDEVVVLSRPFEAPNGRRRAIGLLLKRAVFNSIFVPEDASGQEAGALALIRGGGNIVSEFIKIKDGDWQPENPLPVGKPGDAASGLIVSTKQGISYHYALAPVRGTLSNVVLATPMSVISATDWMRFLTAMGAPLLMLALGIFAIFAGVDHLVLRWVARFRQATLAYARGDYAPRLAGLDRAPLELSELGAGINDMAGRVQERSTALEEALGGKDALLRELHHRVKNNFQMIASLLALQRRELPGRLRTLLRVPEDRVLAMAAAYKASYATGEIGHVSTLDLLRDITTQLRQSFSASAPVIRLQSEEQPVWLDLDQAVPLGLLVSEILTAALDRIDAGNSPIDIFLRRPEPAVLRIEIASEQIASAMPSTGLAARLVAAYRAQVNATLSLPTDHLVVIAMPLQNGNGNAPNHPGRVELGE